MDHVRPSQVIWAVRLMWAMWTMWSLGSAYLLVMLGVAAANAFPSTLLLGTVYLLVIIALAALVRAVATGKEWARIVYASFACLSIFTALGQLVAGLGDSIWQSAISIFMVAAYSLVVGLLFHPRARQWFRRSANSPT